MSPNRLNLCLLVLLLPVCAQAQPVEIVADSMVLEHQQKRAEFTRNVKLTRGDFSLFCDRLLAFYRDSDNQLDHAEAYGHVRIRQGAVRGKARKAILDQHKNQVTLIGEAELERPEGKVEGERITHNLSSEKTVVKPGKKSRARLIIESGKKQGPPADGGVEP